MKVSDAQELMRKTYYRKDRKRGVDKTFSWLIEEVGELSRALREGDKNSIEEEIADVFAWLLSLANLLNVSVEEAFSKKYGKACPRCKSLPCRCEES